MTINNAPIEKSLGQAAVRLLRKGLLTPGDTLSERIPEQDCFVMVRIGTLPAGHAFEWTPLSAPPRNLHHRIYLARPDIGAIAAGEIPWTSKLARLGLTMPDVFDEQVRHLGKEVSYIKTLSTDKSFAALSNGANAYCFDDLALCLGMTLERLLLNLEILEKCAQSFILAQSTGSKVRHIPWLVRFIANGRLKKDRNDAAARHRRGERAVMKAGY
ncbi:hypothetical protein GCM10011491_13450 [Brucella endophytica]|uniref:Uncharacterized protein n=1 Tax=Brucella endophytica TaxID=1963359 RepID=A0A916S999_9HYPH|nr:hypothetical protein [Brucella endophytica]GGA87069.1 hypothetical protein GCM10011491_13450 [Brucella endophytica]